MPKSSSEKLTKKKIDAGYYSGKEKQFCALWDSAISGFGLRIFPTGRKAFIVKYRALGRQRMQTIGTYGKMTLDEARRRAREILVEVQKGGDPATEQSKSNQIPTFSKFADSYLDRHARPHKKTWRTDEARIRKYLKPEWGTRRLDSIMKADVITLHQKIGSKQNHKYEANRVLALVSKIFECAIEWGILPEETVNPTKRVKTYREIGRDRWVKTDEMPRLVEAIDAEPNVYIRAAFWLYLFTGMRKRELLGVRWEWVDTMEKEVRLPDSKANRIHYIPLSGPALAILNGLPRLEGNPYVFPGRNEYQSLVNVDKAWRRIRRTADVEDVHLHDLRRTVGSWMAQSGNSLLVIQKALNQTTDHATRVYARMSEDPVRKALEEHGRRLLEVVGKVGNAGEVVPILLNPKG